MGRQKDPIWAHFLSIRHDWDSKGLKSRHNTTHLNAWCRYCVETTISEFIGDAQDLEDSDPDVSVFMRDSWVGEQREHRAMGIVKPIRGVKDDMAKHLSNCTNYPLNVVSVGSETGLGNLSQVPSSSQLNVPLRQTTLLCKSQDVEWTKAQIAEFQVDFLRVWVAINASYYAADHPEVRMFFTKWVGIKSPSRWLLQNRLLKNQMDSLELQMKAEIFGEEGTLSCDGWNNKKRQHLVTFLLNVKGKTYPLDVIDSTAAYKGGAEAFQQISSVLTKLKETMGVIVVGLCTDNGADQVCMTALICEMKLTNIIIEECSKQIKSPRPFYCDNSLLCASNQSYTGGFIERLSKTKTS